MLCLKIRGAIAPSTLCKVFIDVFKMIRCSDVKCIDCYISSETSVSPAHRVINYTINDINHIDKKEINENVKC